MAVLKTKVEELPESKVRLEVEVPEEDVQHAMEHAASDLAGSIRVPGFRKGKVPIPVVLARVGREAVWEEALRGHIDSWFWSAATRSGVRPVANPEVELGDVPAENETFHFTATVLVMPLPEVPDWTKLEVGAQEAEVPDEVVESEIERLRSSVAELVPVTDRPVVDDDTVVIDLESEAEAQRDFVVEVGDGMLAPDVEEALVGMSAGDTKTVELSLPTGEKGEISVTVKDIKEKLLPPVDDDLAKAASEFDTIAELREDIESRLLEQLEEEIDAAFRAEVIDAVVAEMTFDDQGLAPLIERRTAALANSLANSLQARGISLEVYLASRGQSQEQLVEQLREQADRSVRREIALEAIADKLEIEVTDADVEAVLRDGAAEAGDDPDEEVAGIEKGGAAFEGIRSDLRLKTALDQLSSEVERIPIELAEARERLWTPEKERAGSEMKIWTPGSEENP